MSVVVRPVSTWRDRREFVELPYRLHSTSAVWVPPLRLERHIFLMRSQNALFSHGDAQLFLAWRDGRVVGRISAQYDDNFNAYHDNHGACSASSSSRTRRTSCRRCWRPPRRGCGPRAATA